jgi:hypothetical protein
MANSPHLFKNLVLSNVGKVDGINEGFDIVGKDTFKFKIVDNKGRTHIICIPNLLYLPELKSCLLLPQHWAQEAGDGQTWMLIWLITASCSGLMDGRQWLLTSPATCQFSYTVSSSRGYHAFAGTFKALEAPFF